MTTIYARVTDDGLKILTTITVWAMFTATRFKRWTTAIDEAVAALCAHFGGAFCGVQGCRRNPLMLMLAMACLLVVVYAPPALADVTMKSIWGEVTGLVYGEGGLIIGFIILLCALFALPKAGAAWAIGIAALGFCVFLVPGGLATAQKWGKGLGGGAAGTP